MSRFMLVATVKDEGPYILEWVAHHRLCGFDDIVIYQNDSTDTTQRTLRVLARMGVIRYFDNVGRRGDHQTTAYRRAARLDCFREAEWCMALDGDEYLAVAVGDGSVQDLVATCERADAIFVNWRNFGSGGQTTFDESLLTSRFTRTAPRQEIIDGALTGVKTLFRTRAWSRPGIHLPKKQIMDDPVCVNGSGLIDGAFHRINWRSADPAGQTLAQVNHYILRDLDSFLLKSNRGSANAPTRELKDRYFRLYDRNEEEDRILADRSPQIWDEMRRLDAMSDGRLFQLRSRAFTLWRKKVDELKADPEFAELRKVLTAEEALPA